MLKHTNLSVVRLVESFINKNRHLFGLVFIVVVLVLSYSSFTSASPNILFGPDSFGSSDTNTVPGWVDSDGSGSDVSVKHDGDRRRDDSPTQQFVKLKKKTTSITKTGISTVGNENVHLLYYWRGKTAEPGDSLVVEWKKSSDSSYTILATHDLDDEIWSDPSEDQILSGADNTSIDIRFRLNTNADDDEAIIDDVTILGDTTGDTTAPILNEVTPVSSPTNDNTPDYTFSSDEAGTISYAGDCSSATTVAVVGNNTVIFNTLADGHHSNCTVKVTDSSVNQSLALAVSAFTIDTTAPTVVVSSGASDPTGVSPIPVVITFSESVADFDLGDVVVTNGTASNFAGGGTSYTVDVTPAGDPITVTVSVDADTAHDTATHGNTASNTFTSLYDATAPSVTIMTGPTSSTNNSTPTFTFTMIGGNSVECQEDSGAYGPCSGDPISHTFSAPLTDGPHSFSVKAIDGVHPDSIATANFTVDTNAPVITLVGSTTIDLTVGDSYSDAGAIALDNIDGNITASMITVNGVNTATIGTYSVTYNVSDAAGNPATQVTRTVNINPTPTPTSSSSSDNGSGGSGGTVGLEFITTPTPTPSPTLTPTPSATSTPTSTTPTPTPSATPIPRTGANTSLNSSETPTPSSNPLTANIGVNPASNGPLASIGNLLHLGNLSWWMWSALVAIFLAIIYFLVHFWNKK